jgi:hypothetical protein
MRHGISDGKDTIGGENAADFCQERQFWQIDQRLDIDREIDACFGERKLEGMPLQTGDCGIAVPAVANRR